ncbi:MAG: DNA polymerase/3'-5' exonuclease PolX [Halobacteriales archaeon]|nr:DNA polymerase/3'-5' exonuclease PolX [Halobacteriales archaeon]
MSAENDEIAAMLEEFADRLEAKSVEYKPRAYRNAAESVREASPGELDAPKTIPDVGDAIASKIEEYRETGHVEELEELREEMPVEMVELTRVEGIGPKTVGKLYDALGITNLDELEEAARKGRIQNVEGFGEKTEQNILEGIEFARQSAERSLLGDSLPKARELVARVEETEGVVRAVAGGSIRRRKETIGDIDIVVVSEDREATADAVTGWEVEVIQKGDRKTSFRDGDEDVDLHLVKEDEFGAALQYFTGSKKHNVKTRDVAIDRDLKLNEYGVWKEEDGEEERVAGESEEEVYAALKMAYPPPELREDRGEVESALEDNLPELVTLEDVRGELHSHTERTDGGATLEEMVAGAIERGMDYLAVTDHTEALGVAGGLTDDELLELAEDVRALDKDSEIRVFAGTEANILKDGSIDVSDDVLAQLDVVVASIHGGFRMNRDEATERLVSAVRHEDVDILGHPSGRLINRREGYDYDFETVLEAADDEGVALELNANPHRLDVRDTQVKRCVEAGVPVAVNTDAHTPSEYDYVEYGVATARRGWAEADDILNTRSVEELEDWLET